MNTKLLSAVFTKREPHLLFSKMVQILPDPDPVLQKTGKQIETYRELTSDAHVFANMQQRKAGTLSLKWELKKQGKAQNYDYAAGLLRGLDIDTLLSNILDAVFYGYSVLEIMWEYRDGLWYPATVEEKPQEWFFFDDENNPRYRGEAASDGVILPENKFLVVQHQASYYNPYGEKILSRCYWPVTFKRGGYQFWVTFTEKYGMPFLLAKQPRSYTKEEAQTLLDALEKMLTDTMAVVPDDSTISFLEGSRSYSSDVYKKFLDFCNSEISKAVLAQTLTTEIQERGTYAASKTHLDIYHHLVQGDKRLVEKTINRLLEIACRINFSQTNNTDLPVFALYEENDVNKALAERDELLIKQGVHLTPEYYKRSYNLREDEFTVK